VQSFIVPTISGGLSAPAPLETAGLRHPSATPKQTRSETLRTGGEWTALAVETRAGRPAPARRDGRRSPAPRSLGQNRCQAHDDRSRPPQQGRYVMIAAVENGVPTLVEARPWSSASTPLSAGGARISRTGSETPPKPDRLLPERHSQRPAGCRRCHLASLVQRSNGGPDHQAEAGETPDVRTRSSICSKLGSGQRSMPGAP
jgi:hypothetical protein